MSAEIYLSMILTRGELRLSPTLHYQPHTGGCGFWAWLASLRGVPAATATLAKPHLSCEGGLSVGAGEDELQLQPSMTNINRRRWVLDPKPLNVSNLPNERQGSAFNARGCVGQARGP